jgi:hypothetical protein
MIPMRSEAVSSLRSWVRDRLGEQEDLLRAVERGVARLAELDVERHDVLHDVAASLTRLGELGLDEGQVAGFVGVDISVLRAGRTRSNGTPPARRDNAASVSGAEVVS